MAEESPEGKARAMARSEITLVPVVDTGDEARVGVEHPVRDCGWLKVYSDVDSVSLLDLERDVEEHLGECDRVTELIDRPLVY